MIKLEFSRNRIWGKISFATYMLMFISLSFATVLVRQAYSEVSLLSESGWNLDGSTNASGKNIGKANSIGQISIFFGVDSDLGLDYNEFEIVDSDGYRLSGTYAPSEIIGKAELTADESIKDYIAAKALKNAKANGKDAIVDLVLVTSFRGVARAAAVKGNEGVSLSLKGNIVAMVYLTINNQRVASKTSISFNANGVKHIINGSEWQFITNIKGNIKGLGKMTEQGSLNIMFGPNEVEGLKASDLKATDNQSREFHGIFSYLGATITFNPNLDEMTELLKKIIMEEVNGASSVEVSITAIKGTAKCNGLSMSLKLNITANVSGYVSGEYKSESGSFSFTGKGEFVGVLPEASDKATISTITISGPTQVYESSWAQYNCTANYSDGSSLNVSASATWSENSSYATITSFGCLTTQVVTSDQNCQITASYGGKSDTYDITIKEGPTLDSVTITGPSQVNESSGAQYTCIANYSDGSSSNVSASATWSENSIYATINSAGYLTTQVVTSNQNCQITASYGGKSDTHDITIKNSPAGDWTGSADFGEINFNVNSQKTGITLISYNFADFLCGGVLYNEGMTTVTQSPPWSIRNNQFTIEISSHFSLKKMTIVGKFNTSFTHASGTWEYVTDNGSTCSGTWDASPSY